MDQDFQLSRVDNGENNIKNENGHSKDLDFLFEWSHENLKIPDWFNFKRSNTRHPYQDQELKILR